MITHSVKRKSENGAVDDSTVTVKRARSSDPDDDRSAIVPAVPVPPPEVVKPYKECTWFLVSSCEKRLIYRNK